MFCHECGKEIADDSKFCPECGANISAPAPEIPMQSTPVQGMPVQSIPKVKEKKSLFRTIISPVVYYPAMVILVALAIILGRSQNKAAEVTDLAQFVGATEQEVVEAFGCEVNEMGWYPGEEELALTCVDGKVAMISVSKDSEYSFAGCKAGDKFEEKREELEKEYRFYNSTEADGDVVYVFEGKEASGSLSVLTDSSGMITQIIYMFDMTAAEACGETLGDETTEEDSMGEEVTCDESYETETTEEEEYIEEGDAGLFVVEVAAEDGYVNFRTGAGTEFDIWCQIYNGEQLPIYEDAGDWLYTEYEGMMGWVASSQVVIVDPNVSYEMNSQGGGLVYGAYEYLYYNDIGMAEVVAVSGEDVAGVLHLSYYFENGGSIEEEVQLVEQPDGSYTGVGSNYASEVRVVFLQYGMSVEVLYSTYGDCYNMSGEYNLTEEYNYDNAG